MKRIILINSLYIFRLGIALIVYSSIHSKSFSQTYEISGRTLNESGKKIGPSRDHSL